MKEQRYEKVVENGFDWSIIIFFLIIISLYWVCYAMGKTGSYEVVIVINVAFLMVFLLVIASMISDRKVYWRRVK